MTLVPQGPLANRLPKRPQGQALVKYRPAGLKRVGRRIVAAQLALVLLGALGAWLGLH